MNTNELTELEGCVLGLIWEMGPCTMYGVRKVLQSSPSAYWSGSAGAVYPLVRRMADSGLVQAQEGFRGKRRHVLYSISRDGTAALRRWIGPPTKDYAVSTPADPIRTRVRFFGALDQDQLRELLELVNARFELEIEIARRRIDKSRTSEDQYDILVSRGAELMALARLAWLNEVREHFTIQPPPTSS